MEIWPPGVFGPGANRFDPPASGSRYFENFLKDVPSKR